MPTNIKNTSTWSPELEERLLAIAWSVWEEIASDALAGLRESEGRNYYRGDELVGLVGEYIDLHGRGGRPGPRALKNSEAIDSWKALSYDEQDKILAKVFKKSTRYGY